MKTRLPAEPIQVASGVYLLKTGSSKLGANVYFVRSDTCWVLVNAGWAGFKQQIQEAAASLFGSGRSPAAIVITHMHPDHTGALPELAKHWNVPVYAHSAEIPRAQHIPAEDTVT